MMTRMVLVINDYDEEYNEDDTNDMERRYGELINNMTHNLTIQNDYIATIPEIRCCAHTLQLAIRDALNGSSAKRIIHTVKDMCKSLRTQVINAEFRRLSPKSILPPLYNATRWSSEYIMVNILIYEKNVSSSPSSKLQFF